MVHLKGTVQTWKPEDLLHRIQFCEWLLQRVTDNQNFLSRVLATDETGFTRNRVFNSDNTYNWSDENLYEIQERCFQNLFSTNVSIEVIRYHLIGPYVIPRRLNEDEYLKIFNEILPTLLVEVLLNVRREMWYLYDRAPPHHTGQEREWINQQFINR